jgi:hypothetical protein
MVLEQLQALRASLRRTTDPLSPYDIDSMIVRKASMGTANKAHMRSPIGQHPSPAHSPNMQQQQQGGTPFTSRSTHAGRMQHQHQHQQRQRQHRAARRAVSTPQLQPGHTGSPQQQQQQEHLRSAVSVSPQQLTRGVSGASSAATAAAGGSNSVTLTPGQQQQQQQQLGSSPMASSYPGPKALSSSLQQIWDDSQYIEDSESGSGRSVYLEHSASTGDEDQFGSWNGVEGVDSQDVPMHQPGLRLSSGPLAHPSSVQPGQHGQQQQQSEHPTCGFGSFTSQPSTSTSLIGSRALSGCPYAAAARGAAAAAASSAGPPAAATAANAAHNAGPET